VTSFARTHAITAAGNGGMVGLNDEEQLDQTLMRRRWGRRSRPTCSAAEREQPTASDPSPTAPL